MKTVRTIFRLVFTCIIFLLIAILFVVSTVTAQNQMDQEDLRDKVDAQPVVKDVEGLRLNLRQYTQNPGSKKIRFDLTIKSKISSDRVQLRWQIEGVSELIEGKDIETFSVQPDQVLTKTIVIVPRALGITRVRAIVEAFEIDGTRVATATKAIASDANGKLLFTDTDEQVAEVLFHVRNIAAVILGMITLGILSYMSFKAFRNWLESD